MSHGADVEELALPSRLDELDRVDATTIACARRAGFDDTAATEVAIAVIEAVTNAIIHGNRFDDNKRVRIAYGCAPGALVVTIEDQGSGFDLCMVPDPTDPDRHMACSGRGIFIMQQVMDEVEFDISEETGTKVTLTKRV